MPLEWSGPRGALPAGGGDLMRERQDRAAPDESMVLAGRGPDSLASENGATGHKAIARLMWSIRRRRKMSEPTTLDQASSGTFQGVVDEVGLEVEEGGDDDLGSDGTHRRRPRREVAVAALEPEGGVGLGRLRGEVDEPVEGLEPAVEVADRRAVDHQRTSAIS